MLAPHVRFSGIVPTVQARLKEEEDTYIRLAEGNSVYLVSGDHKLIEKFKLVEFTVQRNSAQFTLQASTGQLWVGSHTATPLHRSLTVKLPMPIVLLHSRDGLRVRFSFRVSEGHKVMTHSEYGKLSNAA